MTKINKTKIERDLRGIKWVSIFSKKPRDGERWRFDRQAEDSKGNHPDTDRKYYRRYLKNGDQITAETAKATGELISVVSFHAPNKRGGCFERETTYRNPKYY